MTRKIAIAGDHASFGAKSTMYALLKEQGYDVTDCGPHNEDVVNYIDYACKVAKLVADGEVEKGILLCGSGIGMSIAANKISGVHAALCHDHLTALMARKYNNANIVCAGSRTTGIDVIKEIVETFLHTDFLGGDHADRVHQIDTLH